VLDLVSQGHWNSQWHFSLRRSPRSLLATTHGCLSRCWSFLHTISVPYHPVKFFSTDVKRTRDPSILNTCDIVVDVGAIYDESKQRFDHHQRGFDEVFGHGFTTKLSSAGLIYKSGHLFCPRHLLADDSSLDISVGRSFLANYSSPRTIKESKAFG
jgi:Uncharacterised protein family (UPF0160)